MKRMVLSICGFLAVIFLMQGCSGQSGAGRRHDPVPVRVTVVERSADAASRSYVGTVRPSKSVVLSCPYSGTLKTFAARRGDAVTKGDVVADVESQAVRSSWKMAHAALEQAEDGYRRLMQVHETGSVTDVKVVEVKTQLDRARASAEAADSALAACKVKAPFSGVVSDVFAEEGVELSPAEPLVRLLDVSSLEIEISVPENEVGLLSSGQVASVSVPALGGVGFSAVMDTRGLVASPVSHSYGCTLVPASEVQGLMPGMVCKVTFADREEGIVIPASAVRTDESGRYVWTVADGRVQKRHIGVGGFSGKGVLVSSGLSEGNMVITEGVQKVSGGMAVTIVE